MFEEHPRISAKLNLSLPNRLPHRHFLRPLMGSVEGVFGSSNMTDNLKTLLLQILDKL